MAVLVIPVRNIIPGNFWLAPILGALGVSVALTIAGLAKRLPQWALPSLGLVISLANLLAFKSIMYGTPGLLQLKNFLWTDFIPGRVLYALIVALLGLVPSLLLLAWLGRFIFRQSLGSGWTLIPFLLYVSNLMTPFFADPYQGLEPYQLLFTLVLAGGALVFIRASGPLLRLAALYLATLICGLILSLGIYQIYPLQSWVGEAGGGFPRWWDGLQPILATLALLAGLYLTTVIGKTLYCQTQSEALSA